MGLRDDIAMMERHSRNGTFKEFMEGTAPILGAHERVSDPSAADHGKTTYDFIVRRGD